MYFCGIQEGLTLTLAILGNPIRVVCKGVGTYRVKLWLNTGFAVSSTCEVETDWPPYQTAKATKRAQDTTREDKGKVAISTG